MSTNTTSGTVDKYLYKQDSLGPVAIQKGLQNKPGENNCFLNSAIQVLWHIRVFRKSLRQFTGHYCSEGSCICCATLELFKEIRYSKESSLPPDKLRIAMAMCFESQNRFQLGLMDDAAECFEKILERLHYNLAGDIDPDTCDRPHCITHKKFAMNILEDTWCRCGETSEPFAYTELVHYVSAAALITKSKESGKKVSFAHLLKQAGSIGDQRECPNYSRCKQILNLRRTLMNSPEIVAIGLIWDSATPSVDHIRKVVERLGLSLNLSNLYDNTLADDIEDREYHLQSVVTYYGRHYSTFSYHRSREEWVYFDDSIVRTVGSDWYSVKDQFYKAHYQPLLLVYSIQSGTAVDMSLAPKEIVKMKVDEEPPPEGDLIALDSFQALQESLKAAYGQPRLLPTTPDEGDSQDTNHTEHAHQEIPELATVPVEESINLMSFESIKYPTLTTPTNEPHPQQQRILPQVPIGTDNSDLTPPTSFEVVSTHPQPSAPVNQELLTDALGPAQHRMSPVVQQRHLLHMQPCQRYPGQQPYPQQQYPGQQPYPQQQYPGRQPYPQQRYPGQQPYPQQRYPGQQPYPQQPYPGQQPHYSQQTYPGQQFPYQQRQYPGQQALYSQQRYPGQQPPYPGQRAPNPPQQYSPHLLLQLSQQYPQPSTQTRQPSQMGQYPQPSSQMGQPSQMGQYPQPSSKMGQLSSQRHHSPQPSSQRNHSPQPSSQRNHSPQPSSQRNHSPQPSSQRNHSPQPSSQRNHSPQPSSQRNHSPQPSLQRNHSPQPSSQTNKPSQPSSQRNHSPQPSSQTHKPSQPSSQTHKPSQPSSQTHKPSQPSSQRNHSPQPSSQMHKPSQPSTQDWMTFSSDFSQNSSQYLSPSEPRPQLKGPSPLLTGPSPHNETTTIKIEEVKNNPRAMSESDGRLFREIMATWNKAESSEHSDEVVSLLLYRKTNRLIEQVLANPSLPENTRHGLLRLKRDTSLKVDQLSKCSVCKRRAKVSNSTKCRPCQLRSMISLSGAGKAKPSNLV